MQNIIRKYLEQKNKNEYVLKCDANIKGSTVNFPEKQEIRGHRDIMLSGET